MAILPLENLSADPALDVESAAMQWAIWNSLQAQPRLHAQLASHRRDLPAMPSADLVEGYLASGRFYLRYNGKALECAGSLGDCAPRLTAAIAAEADVVPRPVPNPETLRILARANISGADGASLERAVTLTPECGAAWLAWASQSQRSSGPASAIALLQKAPLARMPAYDAARIRVQLAELGQDRKAYVGALLELAKAAPADVEFQRQAAQQASAIRDFSAAEAIYDHLNSIAPDAIFLNQSAYIALFSGNRQKAEKYAAAAEAAAPKDPRFIDTRGEVAYAFGDYAAAVQHFEHASDTDVSFLGGIELWKAALAASMAGDKLKADAFLGRYLEFRTKAGLRNTLLLQGVWAWHTGDPATAIEKFRIAADSLDRGRALLLQALIALNRGDMVEASRIRLGMEKSSVESAFLASLINGAPPPPTLPFPPDAMAALHYFLKEDKVAARRSLATAREKMDPFNEGYWRKLDAMLNGRKPDGLLPPSPDDWLAILLR